MDTPQSFQTIAEISIAFAGFSGLVIALRRDGGPLTETQAYRLRVLLLLAFGAMFLSLLPDLIAYFGVTDATTWAVCCAGCAAFSLAFSAWWLGASRHMMKTVPEIFSGYALARMATGHAIVALVLLTVLFPSQAGLRPAACQLALVWYLLHAAQQFSRMLFIQPRTDSH